MNATRRSLEQWRDYVGGCLDFRPEEGIFRIARDMFTEPELFDLEMELIFEKNWIYACHESELARPHDFVTLRAGRQPLIVTRDGNGQLHALVNACQHRGATLVRVGKGNQSTFTCPFHAWCYKNDGRLVKVKAPGEYPEGFDKATRGLKKARIQSYRGFVFVSLDVAGEDDLVDFLGDARVFLDMLVAQSPSGELEVLPGTSTYTYEGNWKLQNENGLDGYHVSTVHYNYVATVQHRQQVEAERGGAAATLDYSKLGAGDAATDDGWFSLRQRPQRALQRDAQPRRTPRLRQRDAAAGGGIRPGPRRVDDASPAQPQSLPQPVRHRPDQLAAAHRPPAGLEPYRDRQPVHRRQGRVGRRPGEPDPPVRGLLQRLRDGHARRSGGVPRSPAWLQARLERWSDISRGHGKWLEGATPNSQALGIAPLLTGTEITHEGLYVNQHAHWRRFLLDGLERLALRAKEVTP
ncbi:Rieske 2Fe-2S domain-containing protein [Pseudomonas aeruginosa]|nr:Rieske 2Fe-2S domain-containing protein [Pseudomonas aeruginosa]